MQNSGNYNKKIIVIFEIAIRKILFFWKSRGFARFGRGSYFERAYLITNKRFIRIGSRVSIRAGLRLEPITSFANKDYKPLIDIGDNAHIERNVHIGACDQVRIGNNVVLASNVYISDHDHGYENVGEPIMLQPLRSKGPVVIGDNCWIGQGVVITSGVTLGKHCVVGASSVVVRSFPDYCVVVGSPARIVKRYDQTTKRWEKVVGEA